MYTVGGVGLSEFWIGSHIDLYSHPCGINLICCVINFQRLFITTARQLKRIDSVRRSPIYIHFDESVVGTSSIRAYRREEQFIAKMDKYIDNSQKPWYMIMVAQRSVTKEILKLPGFLCNSELQSKMSLQ